MTADITGKIKIKPNSKHLDYLNDMNWVNQLPDGTWGEIDGFPLANYGDYYEITTDGKFALYNFRSSVITWSISLLALTISILSYAKK